MKIEFIPVVSRVPLVLLARSDVDTFPYTHWQSGMKFPFTLYKMFVLSNTFACDSNEFCILI